MLRVGVPALLDDALLKGFPPSVELVRIDAEDTAAIEVEMLLAPWLQKQAEQVLSRARGVKVVQICSAGIDSLRPFIPQGAVLCNAQGLHDIPTAELAVTLVLASLKNLPVYAELQREGRWITRAEADRNYTSTYGAGQPLITPVLIDELYAKRVLIVGYGAIGKAIEARLAPFGAEILRVARTAREGVAAVADLHMLLPQADIVVLIMPLTEETRHLIDAAAIAKMKQGALLVNAARGAVVDTDALVEALEKQRIRAALDVTDPEPLPEGHPLWRAPGLLLTPHVSSASVRYLGRIVALMRSQVIRYLEGHPLENVIEGAY